uniref:Ubiquitin carboxyl-terminal hydrolase 32 n=1 Tax=Ornithodoros turicata TaxID=34597 RepID=A0A2R5LJ75_9ACAR
MGAKDSKSCSINCEDAYRRVSESELRRLRDAFKRASNLSGIITRQAFIKEVLGEFVPLKLAEHIFQACGGTSKGITFKDLLCGLVLLTRGSTEEKLRFIFNLYANEAGTHVCKNDMIKLVLACDGGFIPEAVADCFLESERVPFEDFAAWLLLHPDATSLTRWLLNEPCSVTLSNDLETPTFYQTLAGVTHLEETDIIELEKRYWMLKTQSRTGRFDLEMLIPLISPPVPVTLCKGIFNAFDENRDNHIDFKEMACGVSACCRGPLAERQKFCFKVFDEDMDGGLSRQEVYNMVASLMALQQEERNCTEEPFKILHPPTKEAISALVNEVFENHDTNKNGIISLDEYLVWTVSHSLANCLLNLMFQVCHIVLGLRPSTREEEGEIVRGWLLREERRGLKVGQVLHLISMDWWKSWSEYIEFRPGSSGFSSTSNSGVKLTSKLQRKIDSSVARSSMDDGCVVLSSVTSLSADLEPVLPFDAQSGAPLTNGCPSAPASPKCSRTAALQGTDAPRPPSLTPSPNLARKVPPPFPQRPPSIDNTGLVMPTAIKATVLTGEGGRLHRNVPLVQGRDFEVVPESVWRALYQWYGGSPALPRQVVQPLGGGSPELELYPVCLKLFRHHTPGVNSRVPATSWTTVVGSVASAYVGSMAVGQINTTPKRYLAYLATFSRTSSLRQVFDFLCARLRLRSDDTRLWQMRDETNLVLLEEEPLTLEQLGIEDGEQILIEVRNKDQTWPEEMSCIINARLDQKNQGPTEKGATGLNNLGNTCFMNAAVQCVSNTRPLTQYFINQKHLYELNRSNPLGMKGHIAKRYGDLVHDLWSGTSKTVAPLKLRWTIGKYAPRFNGFQQHDSQELLAFLLDGLHEDLNRVQDKPYIELKDSAGRPDNEVAWEAWENHVRRNKSVVVDLFHGQLQSTVTCMVCGNTSVRFDPFNFLSLPLPMESCVHVEVVVVRLDGSVPVRYGLQLNPEERYAAVKAQVSALCGLGTHQLMLTEVVGAVIKLLLPDDRRLQATSPIGALFAYEVLPDSLASCSDEDSLVVSHREPQTLTQIQRMVITNSSGAGVKLQPLANGSVPTGDVGPSLGDANGDLTGQGPGSEGVPERPDTPGSTSSGSAAASGSWSAPYMDSGMTTSLTSNSSAADLSELARRNFVIAYHRKMMRQDVYFLSSQKTRPTLFGLPLLLPCHDGTSKQDLYRMVWTQVARLVSPLPPSEATVPNHAQDCDDSLGYEYPFTLKAVQKDGLMCSWCPWYKFCRGCKIDCNDADFSFSSLYLSIDWDPTALHLRYQASQERVYVDHPSVERTRQQKAEPISVHDCLEAFTKEEHLGEDEKYYCSHCKQHQLASKKLQIYRLPPVMIIHLKRFQLLNGKWVKSQKIVRFPFVDFDPTDYLSPVPRKAAMSFKCQQRLCRHQQGLPATVQSTAGRKQASRCPTKNGNSSQYTQNHPCVPSSQSPSVQPVTNGDVYHDWDGGVDTIQDHHQHRLHPGYHPLDLKYQMYALACHSGILGGGHYVSYACNPNNRWYCYNDSSCKEVKVDQIDSDSAYMLFYEREGIDYEAYMPDTEGKVPDARDIDDEFENDFRKMCILQ